MKFISQWIQANQHKAIVILLIALSVIVLYLGARGIYEAVHNWNYTNQQTTSATAAAKAEADATLHEGAANQLAEHQKELEDNEKQIIQRQTESRKTLDTDRQRSAASRSNLNKSLNQKLPDRTNNTGTDDQQLRADADRARQAFDGRRSEDPATIKP